MMYKKTGCTLICWLAAACLMAGCGNSGKQVSLIDGLTEVNFDIDYPVGQITKDVAVTQNFISNCDSVTDIQLYGATYTRDNTATVYVDLTCGDETIAEWTIDSSLMEDNTVIVLPVEKDDDCPDCVTDIGYVSENNSGLKGKEMLITISSPDGEPEQSPTFWMTEEDIYPDGCLNVAGYDQYNDLWFQVDGVR